VTASAGCQSGAAELRTALMKRLAIVIAVVASGCTHVIKNVSDCDEVQGEKRVECGACLVANKADGWLGTYEYRPDAEAGKRCVRKK
jgi:uncharacterized protein YceK